LLPQNAVVLELHRTTASENHCSYHICRRMG